MSETTVNTLICSSCKLVYPSKASFRGKCSVADCTQLICEDCWAHGVRQCGTHQASSASPFPKLKTDSTTPSIAELAKQGVERVATEQALGVAMVHAVGQSATRGIQLLKPEVHSSADGSSLWLKKRRFFRQALIIGAESASNEKGVSGLRDQAVMSVERAKAYHDNVVLKCFACARPSDDMIAFAERFSDPNMSLYLIDDTGKVYYNLEDHRAQRYLKLFTPVPSNVPKQ